MRIRKSPVDRFVEAVVDRTPEGCRLGPRGSGGASERPGIEQQEPPVKKSILVLVLACLALTSLNLGCHAEADAGNGGAGAEIHGK